MLSSKETQELKRNKVNDIYDHLERVTKTFKKLLKTFFPHVICVYYQNLTDLEHFRTTKEKTKDINEGANTYSSHSTFTISLTIKGECI